MRSCDQASIAVVALAWVGVVWGRSPTVSLEISPSPGKFYIGEKNTVNNTFHFPDKSYKSVKLTLYPTIDVPDVVITKVTSVKIGRKLKITGRAKPVMDWGIEHFQVPGKALSCVLDLGDVIKTGKAATPDEESITIQYEAVVLGQVPEFSEVGHQHELGASVEIDGSDYVIGFMTARFSYRSLPLLFRQQANSLKAVQTRVVEMIVDPKRSLDVDQKVFAY